MQSYKPIFYIRQLLVKITAPVPIIMWLLLIYGFDEPYLATMTLLFAILHEIGHASCALIFCAEPSFFATLAGPRMRYSAMRSYKDTVIIALGGPMINIIAAIILVLFTRFSAYFVIATAVNILTAAVNLLPLVGNDGYTALRSLLLLKMKPTLVHRIMATLSSALCILICFLSLYLMSRHDGGYWCYFLSFWLLLRSLTDLRSLN